MHQLSPGVPTTLDVPATGTLTVRPSGDHAPLVLAAFVRGGGGRERLSMYTSQAVNHTWRLSTGHALMSTDARELWEIVRDDCGVHYAGGGADDTCHPLLGAALTACGAHPDDLGPDGFFTAFAEPVYAPGGAWSVRPTSTAPGTELVLRARADQTVVLLVCPHRPRTDTAGATAEVTAP